MTGKILRLHDFKVLKAGTFIEGKFGQKFLFLSCAMPDEPGAQGQGQVSVHDLSGDVWDYDETEIIHDAPFVSIGKVPSNVVMFERSDDWKFIIYKDGKKWRLVAGCREFTESSLDKLKEVTLAFWEDNHGVSPHFDGHDDVREANRRRSLNRETRAKLNQAFKKLAPKTAAVKVAARKKKAKKRAK
jgi:hypothetical protein